MRLDARAVRVAGPQHRIHQGFLRTDCIPIVAQHLGGRAAIAGAVRADTGRALVARSRHASSDTCRGRGAFIAPTSSARHAVNATEPSRCSDHEHEHRQEDPRRRGRRLALMRQLLTEILSADPAL